MADKYWWEKVNAQDNSQGNWWDNGSTANEIGSAISNRVDTWLQNHNNYVSNYQVRNKDRKYSYDDSYVSDSADWLTTVSRQKDNFDTEANNILACLDQYGSYLDSNWVNSVKNTLAGARNEQNTIVSNSAKDNEWWSNFGTQELVEAYGSAENAYQYYQRADGYQKKYSGQKYDDIQKALSTLEDGEERSWLNTYQYDLYQNDSAYNSKAASGFKSYEAQKVAEQEKEAEKTWLDHVAENFAYSSADTSLPGAMISNAQHAYRNDTSWREPSDNWSDGEKRQFGYLYATSPAQAYQFAEQVNNYYNTKAEYEAQQAMGAKASSSGWSGVGHTLGAIATAPLGLADLLDDAVEYSARGTITQDGILSPFEYSQAVTSGISNKLNEKYGTIDDDVWLLGGKGVGDIYSLGVSTANSMLSALTLGGTGTLVNFIGQGGAAGVDDALSRGATAEQALLYGTVIGSLEGLTEMIPAEQLIKAGASPTLKNYLKQILKQGVSEFVEEGSSSFFGNLADDIIMRDKSQYNLMVKQLMEDNPGMTEEEASGIAFKKMSGDIAFDAIGGAFSGATSGAVTVGGKTLWESQNWRNVNKEAVQQYGENTKELIQEGLESDPKSESYELAQKYQKQVQGVEATDGKKGKEGKPLTGFQIRSLVEANDAQFKVENFNEARTQAHNLLKEHGENASEVWTIAELVAKKVTGQELTRAEKGKLARSAFGSQVAKEIENANKTTQLKYKSLTQRVGEKGKYNVSESGQATIRATEANEEKAVSLDNFEITNLANGQMTVKLNSGEEVSTDDLNLESEAQAFAFSGVAEIEHMTPAAATAMIKAIDLNKPVGEQLDGMDEAFTYGYNNYSVEDMKSGDFTKNLTTSQKMSAYELGKSARAISDEAHDAPLIQMRTAQQAALSKKVMAAQQKAKFTSTDVEVYFEDGGTAVKIDEAGLNLDENNEYDQRKLAGINTAKFLSKMGLGGKFYFYQSYESTDADGNPIRVYRNDKGEEVAAPNGLFKAADGSIHIDLNAGMNGEGTTLFTLGHEATHFVKEYSREQFNILAELVTEAYSKTDLSMRDRVNKKQKELYDHRNRGKVEGDLFEEVSYDEAYEEVVADAMSTMFTDGNIYEKIAKIKAKDKGLFNTIRKFFRKLIAKFKSLYETLEPDQRDAQDIRQLKDMFDQIQDAFAQALVESSENFRAMQAMQDAGDIHEEMTNEAAFKDSKTAVLNQIRPPYTDGSKAFNQFVDELNPEARKTFDLFYGFYQKSRVTNTLSVSGKKVKGVNISSLYLLADEWNDMLSKEQKWADAAQELADFLPADIRKRMNMNEDGSLNPTMLEKEFKMPSSMAQRLVDALAYEKIDATYKLGDKTIELPTIESRQSVGGEAYRRAIIDETRKLFAEGKLKKVGIGTMSKDRWGSLGFLAANGKTGASGDFTTVCPQMMFNRGCWYCYRRAAMEKGVNNKLVANSVWYTGEILRIKDSDIEALNRNGGLRIQSFGDWMPHFSAMLADVLYDAELRGLQVKIITKEPSMINYIAALREQGIGKNLYFNLSADYTIERGPAKQAMSPDSLDTVNPERPYLRNFENGFWWKRAMTVEEANKYREKYPWVNTRIVATTQDEFIRGLKDSRVDVVTGYHGNIREFERVDSTTGEHKVNVEALGDAGMPRFAFNPLTNQWVVEYEGKTSTHKKLAQAIAENNLQMEYYTKTCCITGRCATCEGKCGKLARDFNVKNATNRDAESVAYWQKQMQYAIEPEFGDMTVDEDVKYSERVAAANRAREYFGTTENPYHAGYMLADGTMLNFRNEDNRMGWDLSWIDDDAIAEGVDPYHIDHHVIYEMYDGKYDDDPLAAIDQFVDEGNVRIVFGLSDSENAIQLSPTAKPTAKQYDMIRQLADQTFSEGKAFGVGLSGFKTYDKYANGSAVVNDIKYYYANGKHRSSINDFRYSDRLYMDAVKSGDMETVQRLVDEAAKKAGFPVRAYHGSDQFGFTKFIPRKSDDGISLFFSSTTAVAKSYTASNEVRQVGKPWKDNAKTRADAERMIREITDGDVYFDGDVYKSGGKYIIESYAEDGGRYICSTAAEFLDKVELLKKGEKIGGVYDSYLNLGKSLEVDAADHNWNDIDFTPPEIETNLKAQKEIAKKLSDKIKELKQYAADREITLSEAMDRDKEYARLFDESVRLEEEYNEFMKTNGLSGDINTRKLAQYAKKHGYNSVTIRNVRDVGKYGIPLEAEETDELNVFKVTSNPMSTVYILFDSNQVKSADPVTYDADGKVIPLSERFKKDNDDIRYSERTNAPVFYSKMGKVVEGMKQEKFGASSVISMLTGRGVKAEEIRWSGIQAFLDGKKSVTKAELLEFIQGSMLHIEEQVRDNTRRYSPEQQKRLEELAYEIDNAWDEIWELWEKEFGEGVPIDLLGATFVERRVKKIINTASDEAGVEISEDSKRIIQLARLIDINMEEQENISYQAESQETKWEQYKLNGGTNYRELLFKLSGSTYSNTAMQGHWGEDAKGILAHARMQDFEVDGKKMLFIDEIQSDWHNAGSKQGYSTAPTEMLKAEFEKVMAKRRTYHDKVIPVLRMACFDLGLDREATYGELLHKDWNTIERFDEIAEYFNDEDMANLKADVNLYKQQMDIRQKILDVGDRIGSVPDAPFKGGKYTEFVLKRLLRMAAEEGYDSIGWTTADLQMQRWNPGRQTNRQMGIYGTNNPDAIAFEEGYRIEYDNEMRKFLEKYGKQWGAKVGNSYVNPVHNSADYILEAESDIERYRQELDEMSDEERSDEYGQFVTEGIADLQKTIERYRGTKVWSMDITDAMKKSVLEEGQELYSERLPGSVSNRSLLANAFEGITQNSEEYKLIQQYKSHVAELNSLENKLSDFNREIRKIRFGKDVERDAQKLARLENEAKKISEAINKHDKRLLSLEASEPLRKVIERERAKARQQTKDHVKEIQQNKKLRSEQTELRFKIRKAVRDLDKLLNRGNKKLNVKEDLQPVVSKALKAADILFTDNYGNYDMLRNGIGADLSDAEEALVNTCTQMLKDLDKMPTDGYDNWQAREAAESKLKTKMIGLRDVFARERKRLNNTTVSSILGELADAYASLEKSEQSYVQSAYSEAVHNFLKSLQSDVGGAIVKDMTKEQLESVYAAYKMVLTAVRTANKMFNEKLKMSREELGNAVINEVMAAGGTHGLWTKGEIVRSQADWNNTKPVWVANRIGSDTFGKLMDGLFQGQYNFAVDVDEAKQFKLEMDKKYKPRKWDADKQYEFESSTGKKFSLNLQQIMSIYAFSKRDQAYSHLLNGGFVFESNSTVIVDKKGIKRTYLHDGATSYKLNEATLNEILNSLTAEQKAYVDEMQKYLSEVMGAKGNEVSMKLYGIQLFKEKFYFPLRSSGAYMERAKEAEMKKQQGQINLVNSGFTHAVKPEAKNPIILSGFLDVWAEHCNEMSMYHSMVLPMEDFRKVYNYSTVHDEKFDSASVYQTIQDAYGKAATDYIDQLYRELNAGATVDPRETPFKARISKFKKAAVMLSASVVVQQFSAIGRAYALIDPKYFIGTKVNSDTQMSAAEEMKKYAPVAIIKEMGGFDTGTKGSAKAYIMAEQYGKGERLEGLRKDEQYRGDLMGILPAKADELTWCAIWEAVKRETKAKHKDMDVKSDAFLKLVGDRFSEVIEKTQVYDSVLARSANMRSKSGLMQMATAFMAEPTTTINLLEDAIRGRSAKNIARAFGAVAVSIVLNNALSSIVYAMRDDDEDETFMEKYFQSLTSGMIDDINPMSYYPFLKDVYSLFQGYDVERADMSVIADVRDALKKAISVIGKDTSSMDEDQLAEHYKNVNGVLLSLLDAGCSAFGVPVKNVRRDANGIINAWNTIGKDLSGERETSWNSFWDKVGSAAKDTIPVLAWTKDTAKADKLYNAIISGDQAYLDRLKSGYKDDSAYHTAVRKALRENDTRIHEAAQAKYQGKTEEYKRIFRQIQKEGKFSFDDIMSAINSEETKIRSGLEPEKVTSEYSASEYVESIILGDRTSANAMKEDIISAKVANGKTRADAEKDFATSVATSIRDAYSSGLLSESEAERMLVDYAGKDKDDASSKVSYWAFCEKNPKYKDVLTESNVDDYHEFAEPYGISLDVFAQYIEGTKGLATIYDSWGDVEKTRKEQVLEVIDSLPITWQQKDALYLAAGYSENNIWDVPW